MAEEQPTCSRCKKPRLPGCDGTHVFITDPETGEILINPETGGERVEKCRRIIAQQIEAFLGPEIASARRIKGSPLFLSAKKGEPIQTDRTKDNLYIQSCTWPKLLPHLRRTLGCKRHRDDSFTYKVITDQRIKTVFVGDEQYTNRPQSVREDIPTFNSLEDLIGQCDLLIIQLGYLGYKNVAASGALKEALLLRKTSRKPTWLVDDPDQPWNYSNDPDVELFIDENFEVIEIEGVDPGEGYEALTDVGMDVEGDEDEPPPRARPKRRPPPPPPEPEETETDENEFDLPGQKPKWRGQ